MFLNIFKKYLPFHNYQIHIYDAFYLYSEVTFSGVFCWKDKSLHYPLQLLQMQFVAKIAEQI